MKKVYIVLFLIFTCYSFGQSSFESGEIFYRDGTSEKGWLKIKYSTIKFKNRISDKKSIELTYKKVKKVTIKEDGKDYEYHFKIIKGKKKGNIKLLELVKIGEVSIFKIKHTDTVGNFGLSVNYNGATYYLTKDNSDKATLIGSNSMAVNRKSIRKGLIKYFSDCKSLVKKLKNKEFKNKDIVEAVAFYNSNCKKYKE